VAVYSVYLVYYLGHSFDFPGDYVGWCIVGGSGLAAILAVWLLRPHRGRRGPFFKLLLVIFLVAALVTAYLQFGWKRAAAEKKNKPATTAPAAPSH